MTDCRHETIVRVIGDPKSPNAHVCQCGHVITFGHIRRCEIRDGRRYIDGVDQGPAQPGAVVTERMRRSSRKGGAATKGRPPRSKR